MSEGLLFVDMMKENRDRVKYFEANPSIKRLLVKIYLIAEAWAQSKGKALDDVEIVNPKLTNDDRVFFWDMRIMKNDEQEKLGILDSTGQVVA